MSEYGWFKLLVRAVGVLLIGLSAPMLLYALGSIGVGGLNLSGTGPVRPGSYLIAWTPTVVGYASQSAFGLYLLVGAEKLIGFCIAGVRGRCAECGYDLGGTPGSVCPECGCSITKTDGLEPSVKTAPKNGESPAG